MIDRTNRYVHKWNVLPLLALTLVIALSAGAILFVRVASAPTSARISEVDASPLVGQSAMVGTGGGAQVANKGADTQPLVYPACPAAFQFLWPEPGAPPNGGTVHVGDKFALDLQNYGGPDGSYIVSQQAYLSFTYTLMQNVSLVGTGCELAQTITPDTTTFDATLQNEVCNNPSQICTFRGGSVPPGSMAYASGALNNPEARGYFRVAQIAFCATNPGQAIIHWQFEPVTRHTEVGPQGIQMNPAACYEDYVINILPPK